MPYISEKEFHRKNYRHPEEIFVEHRGGDLSSLFSGLSGIVNTVKDNLPFITQTAGTVGAVAGGVKNIYDAAKSAEELKKLKDFNSTLSILKDIKRIKQIPKPNNSKQDPNLTEFLNQVKSGKGLKRF